MLYQLTFQSLALQEQAEIIQEAPKWQQQISSPHQPANLTG